jgi:hypothetical protein
VTTGSILLPSQAAARTGWRVPGMDAADAAAETLRAYLLGLLFVVPGGATGAPRTFRLLDVFGEWPEAGSAVPYPCATLSQMGPTVLEPHALGPTPLEETFEVFGPGSCLWKLAEARVDFQADFWANSDPDRSAMGAALPGAFAPGEDAGRVLLCGPPEYFNRPVRACVLDFQDIDSPDSVFANERRLRATLRCELDVVELRCATLAADADWRLAIGPAVTLDEPEAPEASDCDDCD